MNIKIKNKIYHIIKKEEILDDICKIYKVEKEKLLEFNNYQTFNENDIIFIPKSFDILYIVQPFDNVQKIAEKLHISSNLVKMSTNNKKLFVGQKLFFYFN